jgi:membrane-bound ClpP family serine protease
MSATSVVSTFASVGVAEVSVIGVICLILLLALSEILSASKFWNSRLATMLNAAILPMLVAFAGIVVFRVMAVLR